MVSVKFLFTYYVGDEFNMQQAIVFKNETLNSKQGLIIFQTNKFRECIAFINKITKENVKILENQLNNIL